MDPSAVLVRVGDTSAAAPERGGVIFVYVPSAHAVRALPAEGTDAGLLSGLLAENDSKASGAFR